MKKKFILLFLTLIALSLQIKAQPEYTDISSQELTKKEPVGTDFWLCFMTNYKSDEKSSEKNELFLELFITGDFDAHVLIEDASIVFRDTLYLKGGTVRSIRIDPSAMLKSSEIKEVGASIHVTSDKPISVYGLNRRFQTTDTYVGLPTNVLGNEYRAMCYHISEELSPTFAVVATENNTEVEITPSAWTDLEREPGKPFVVTLNRGDSYQVKANTQSQFLRQKGLTFKDGDLTGSLIRSNKKVAVFSGHECSYVPAPPPRIIACNHLVEELPPISSWGKHFYIGRLRDRSQYTYRVLANLNNTKVFENAKLISILKAGEYVERNSAEDLQITADKPVLVAQYSQGFDNGDKIGDPMMILISPTQQFLKQYRFATPINGSWNHYINVVVPTDAVKTIELDGKRIDPLGFKTLGLSRYSIAYLEVPFGTHFIKANAPFGMYSYGFGFGGDAYDAYGNMGGQSFLEYSQRKDSLPPMAEIKQKEGKALLIFRDDRVDDSGIKSLTVTKAENMNSSIDKFTDAIPMVTVGVNTTAEEHYSFIAFQVTDVAGNSKMYSVCYTRDINTGKFHYILSDGMNEDCKPDQGFWIGAFGKYGIAFESPDFSHSGNLSTEGRFSDATGNGGIFGVSIMRELKPNLFGEVKLSFETYGGSPSAPDSLRKIRDTATGNLENFQETSILDIHAKFLHLSAGGNYFLTNNFYISAGLEGYLTLSKSASLTKKILMPGDRVYANGSNEIQIDNFTDLESIKTLRFGAWVGLGFSYPVTKNINAYVETNFNKQFGSLLDDADFGIARLSFQIGAKYHIYF